MDEESNMDEHNSDVDEVMTRISSERQKYMEQISDLDQTLGSIGQQRQAVVEKIWAIDQKAINFLKSVVDKQEAEEMSPDPITATMEANRKVNEYFASPAR